MKPITLLQKILSVIYYIFILGWFIILGILILSLVLPGSFSELSIDFLEDYNVKTMSARITILAYTLIIFPVTIATVYILRNLVKSFAKNQFFTEYQVTGFRLVGQLIILANLADAISSFIFRLIFNSRLELKISFSDFWLFIALGLFFIILSGIFQKARSLKQENELTI